MIKDIVVLLDLEAESPARSVAVELAKRTQAHVTGLAPIIEPAMATYGDGYVPADVLDQASARALKLARESVRNFEEYGKSEAMPVESRLMSLISNGSTTPFAVHCRTTDLVVLAQDNPDHPQPMRRALIEAALFDGSAPVMLVPYVGAKSFTVDHVMVAWDGSKFAARAVHSALPILALARKIDVVTIGDPPALAGEPGADIALYLARHELNVELHKVALGSLNVSDAILNYTSDHSIDVAVMGGYGHSKIREFVLGGATRGILQSMTIPVLMAH